MKLIEKLGVKHCIFDFDGTLVDSMPYWDDALYKVLIRHGARFPDNVVEITTPMGSAEFCRYASTLGADTDGETIFREIDGMMIPIYKDVVPSKAGVAEKLSELSAAGIGLHLLTASGHDFVDPCLERNGLTGFFANVWTCDDLGLVKSEPPIYEKAARLIGARPSDVVFFDDNVIAVAAASRAGMRAVGVFDESSRGREKEIASVADAYIRSFEEI